MPNTWTQCTWSEIPQNYVNDIAHLVLLSTIVGTSITPGRRQGHDNVSPGWIVSAKSNCMRRSGCVSQRRGHLRRRYDLGEWNDVAANVETYLPELSAMAWRGCRKMYAECNAETVDMDSFLPSLKWFSKRMSRTRITPSPTWCFKNDLVHMSIYWQRYCQLTLTMWATYHPGPFGVRVDVIILG